MALPVAALFWVHCFMDLSLGMGEGALYTHFAATETGL